MQKSPRRWILTPVRPEALTLGADLGIPLPLAQVLANRGVISAEEAELFFNGSLKDLHDPYLMKGMNKAVERIEEAIGNKEKILVFGDYDVDGVLSVVILLRALRSLGADVDYFIPERLKEGYGIKESHLRVVKERGARLVLSVDCGIKALGFAAKAREAGVDVIITDHHRPGETLPDAVAVLNPVLGESGYPYSFLAGVGVVFKLLQALLERRGRSAQLEHYAKLVAIGTIADVAELRGENRLLVKSGLEGLEKVANQGLRCLLDECGLLDQKVSEGDVGFRIAPRINAAGRMGAADDAVRLFFSGDPEESGRLARRLSELNSMRQEEEDKIYSQALSWVQKSALDRRYRMLVLGCETWHRGIIGIVASKLKDLFYRPVLLFTYEDGKAHGSGRSISEFSLIECLDACRDLFLDYGGHTLAVGCVLPRERMKLLRERVNQVAEARLKDEDLLRKVRIDARLSLANIQSSFIEMYARLAPFGVGNPKPIFLSEGVEVVSPPQILQDKHLKFLVGQNGRTVEALAWDQKEWLQEVKKGACLDVVYTLRESTFLGEKKTSLSIEDLRASTK